MSYLTPPLQIFQDSPMKIEVSFLDANGNPFDPNSGIEIEVENPTGIVTIYTYGSGQLTRESIGVYSVVVEASVAGDWQAIGTGLLADGMAVTTPKIAQTVISNTFS